MDISTIAAIVAIIVGILTVLGSLSTIKKDRKTAEETRMSERLAITAEIKSAIKEYDGFEERERTLRKATYTQDIANIKEKLAKDEKDLDALDEHLKQEILRFIEKMVEIEGKLYKENGFQSRLQKVELLLEELRRNRP